MTRFKLPDEIKRQEALMKAIEKAPVAAYPPPPSMAKRLTRAGFSFSRQAIRNYYAMFGIQLDRESGLWLKKDKTYGQK